MFCMYDEMGTHQWSNEDCCDKPTTQYVIPRPNFPLSCPIVDLIGEFSLPAGLGMFERSEVAFDFQIP